MGLKDELENDLALAILVERRHAQKIDGDGGRELIGKIKDVLDLEEPKETSDPSHQAIVEAAIAH